LSDLATVTARVNPIGAQTVTFRLYGVANAVCAGAPVFTNTVTLTNGTAQSASFTPAAAGTYRWVASYEGDANNASVSGTCGDPTETATVAAAPLALPPTLPSTLPPTGAALDAVIALALVVVAVGALMVRVTRRRIA
jgi:hypothetical protein